jgi:hypothetical protein
LPGAQIDPLAAIEMRQSSARLLHNDTGQLQQTSSFGLNPAQPAEPILVTDELTANRRNGNMRQSGGE